MALYHWSALGTGQAVNRSCKYLQHHKTNTEQLQTQQETVVAAGNTDESQDVLTPHEVNAEIQWGCSPSKSTLKHSQPAFTINNVHPIADGIPWGVSPVKMVNVDKSLRRRDISKPKQDIRDLFVSRFKPMSTPNLSESITPISIDDTPVIGFTSLQGKNHTII